jgi:hypothetical protein
MTQTLIVNVKSGGALVGEGPLHKILSAQHTMELDKAGRIAITVPAADARALELLDSGVELNIKTMAGTFAGLLQTKNTIDAEGQPLISIEGTDLLGELNYMTTGYNCRYDFTTADFIASVLGTDATATSLLGGTGWTQGTCAIDASVKAQTAEFNAETRLAALIAVSAQIGHHFRPTAASGRTLDFGLLGASSGFRAINVDGVRVGQDLTYQALIGSITVGEISADVENRLFPLGKDRFDLRDAPTTITDIKVKTAFGPTGAATTTDGTAAASQAIVPVTTTTGITVGAEVWLGDADDWTVAHEWGTVASINAGVSITLTSDLANTYAAGVDVIQWPQFYIEDTTSQATYGVREACPQFGWIGPGDKAADYATQQLAATTLYSAASARMLRYKDAYQQYTLGEVYNLPPTLVPGQKLTVTWRGYTSEGAYLSVGGEYYVMKITRTWTGDGRGGDRGVATVDVSNVARPAPNNQNLVIYNLDAGKWLGV